MRTPIDGMIAPVATPTRDGRESVDGEGIDRYSASKLPIPLYIDPSNGGPGHTADHPVGMITSMNQKDDGVYVDGYLFDTETYPQFAEDVATATQMMADDLAWPSMGGMIDIDPDGQVTSDIFEVSLVMMPANAHTWMRLSDTSDEQGDEVEQSADIIWQTIHTSGWSDLPVADRDREWDSTAAEKRLAEHCGIDEDRDPDDEAEDISDRWRCYAGGFLFQDPDADNHTKGAYKLPIVDIIDGEKTIIPQAVIAVAGVLAGARGGVDIPDADKIQARETIAGIAEHMRDANDTVDWVPQWDEDDMDDDSDAESNLVAALLQVDEPVPFEYFEQPTNMPYTPGFTIQGRRIFGHITHREACHNSWQQACVKPPPSLSGYALFHRYSQRTDVGHIRVGRLTAGNGTNNSVCSQCQGYDYDDHTCIHRTITQAMAHYDSLDTIAHICIGEDDEGNIWASGVLLDDAHPNLRRRAWSGDWREVGTEAELIDLLSLHHTAPGFTHRRDTPAVHGGGFSMIASLGPEQVRTQDQVIEDTVTRILDAKARTAALAEAMNGMYRAEASYKLGGVDV